MTHVLAIVNQKGGVGKTTTAVNLGAGLAASGQRTLIIDCDSQANATRSLGARDPDRTLYEALVHAERVALTDVILPTGMPNLDLVPSSPHLSGAEIELVSVAGRERRLRQAVSALGDSYAYVLLDCPPSLGLLSVNALVAASGVIVPVQCEYLSLEGLGLLMRTLELVQARLNPGLKITGLVMTMFDSRTRLASEVVAEVKQHFPDTVFATIVPRNVRLSEAPSYGETILQYAPGSPGAIAYQSLADELQRRLRNGRGAA
jgi:chromosome partitioning protein